MTNDHFTATVSSMLLSLETKLAVALRDVTEVRRDLEDRSLRTAVGGMVPLEASLAEIDALAKAILTVGRLGR